MDILTRACWYATWCGACGYKVARRRWIDDVLVPAISTCRALMWRTIERQAHVANLPC
jgi:hypothetical protein